MSLYRSLIADYPSRVLDFWTACLPDALKTDREVSITLACLGASVGTILELLDRVKADSCGKQHPMGQLSPIEPQAAALKDFISMLKSPFIGSVLCPSEDVCWKHRPKGDWISRNELDIQLKDIDRCQQLNQGAESPLKVTCADVLTVLRHASAHGGLFVRGKHHEIDQIIFLNIEDREVKKLERGKWGGDLKYRYQFVAASPADLVAFLKAWKTLVSDLFSAK